jgi:hypothetical protein
MIFQVTGAFQSIGVNEQAGFIFRINRAFPEHEAYDLWSIPDDQPIPADQLPELCASSDIAWAL